MAPLAPIMGMVESGFGHACASTAGHAAQQVKNHEAHVPHGILDVVAEDPEVEHVAGKVHEAAVQEHGTEDRCHWRYQIKLRR